MPPIDFPTSTAPGVNATESGGRLINAYAEAAPAGSRSKIVWRRAPGLDNAFTVGEGAHRGALLVGSVLYVVNADLAYTVTEAGGVYTISELGGTVPGTGPVFIESNMRSPTPQILIVHSDGMSEIDSGAVADFSDPDLPSINSICFIDGYFIVTSADGRAFASGLNDTTFSSIDYATAESKPDGLVRGVAFGRDLLLMGINTTEFWGNVGNPTGFPFSRSSVIPVGLKGIYAVAGMENGFPEPLIWVAQDNTVRRLIGYTPQKISTPDLERLIEAVTDVSQIEASVYVAGGHACCALSSDTWTWVYDLSTGEWHERKSYGISRWRAHFGINGFGKWLTFDRGSTQVFALNARGKREGLDPLVWEMRSTQASGFPGRYAVKRASFDIDTGVGLDRGISPIETNPVVSISWSDDGGKTFGNALLRQLGTQGQSLPVDINNAGLTKRWGRQWKMQVSDPVEVSFQGAAMDIEQRAS